nr:unnamed protein product [Callosobruchus analis]
MLVSIVENTNIFVEAITPKYQRSRDVRPTNLPEIKALFGLLYLAGIHKGSRLNTEEIWNRDEPITKTGRNITIDNWFTSYELINELLESHNLTLVGTMRKNKRQLPSEFVNTKQRPVNSSMFAFEKNKTLVSYVPRKGKDVISVSSMHFDDEIDTSTRAKAKPRIITFYNETKGGVDVVDEAYGYIILIIEYGRNKFPYYIFIKQS